MSRSFSFRSLVAIFGSLMVYPCIAQTAGSGSFDFLPAVSYDTGAGATESVAVADVNGDGTPDIVATAQNCPGGSCDNDGLVSVVLGSGGGDFRSATIYDAGGLFTAGVALGDVNGDGKLDIVVANFLSSNVGVLLGNGDGTFQHVVTYGSGGSQNYSVALADVNGDNILDIVTVNQNGFVGILLGKGDATFYPALRFATNQGNGLALAVGDLNGDAKPDVVVGGDLGVSVLLGNGDGTLQKSVIYSSGALQGGQASRVVIADFNRDGKPDVATANYATDTVGVLLGNGDGTMQSVVTYASGAPDAWSLAEADVNQDGIPDLIVGNSGPIGVLVNNGDGTFQSARIYSAGVSATLGLTSSDLNRDGWPDIIVANGNHSLSVLLNTGLHLTSTTLTSTLNPSTYGQLVTFRAMVSGSGVLTGSVVFRLSTGNSLGSAVLTNGVATLTRSLNAGSHFVTAAYKGDATHLKSSSAVLNQVVRQAKTTATLASSANPSTLGQPVTFTAKISSPTVTPQGPVTFTAGNTMLGMAQLSAGKASLTTSSLPLGSTTITVTYSGNSNIGKTSASVAQAVQ